MFSWFNFLTYAVITAVTPGPGNITSMTVGGRLGFKRAVPFCLGIWAGASLISLLCTLFCGLLSSIIPKIKLPMLIVGAAYMLYLAWKTFRSTGDIEERGGRGGFLSGFTLQCVNPKLYLFIIVSIEAYVLPYFSGRWLPLIGFALLLSTMGFSSTLCWSAFGSVFRLIFSKYAKITNTIMALLLVYCAVSLFL